MALTCELCGSTNFVKDAGMFVCQGCGTKYTVEEAQRLMATQNQASTQAQTQNVVNAMLNAVIDITNAQAAQTAQASQGVQAAPTLASTRDFQPNSFDVAAYGAKESNNYACRAWQMLLNEYQGLDHPDEARHKTLVTRAQECMRILDDAARLDPDNNLLCLLLFENCKEIISSVKSSYHYEKDSEGNWKRKNLDYSVKVELPGQGESFEKKAGARRKIIEQQYLDAHPDEVLQREKLAQQADVINGRLAELKGEKKSQGLFNFAGKREVKDRMKPVEEELRGVRGQINELDDKVDAYVYQCLHELAKTHIMLDF